MNALPRPVRTLQDPVTGVTIHQLTEGPGESMPLYFTSSSWSPDGSLFVCARNEGECVNLHVAADGEPLRPLTRFPRVRYARAHIQHMHVRIRAWEYARNGLRSASWHPSEPRLAWGMDNVVHELDVRTGAVTPLLQFTPEDCVQPYTNLSVEYMADGRRLLLATTAVVHDGARIDPPGVAWNTSLRDERHTLGRIWIHHLDTGRLEGPIVEHNGEPSHPIPCPWDPDYFIWVNYLHGGLYGMRVGDAAPKRIIDHPGPAVGHYNWDAANRRLTFCHGTVKEKPWFVGSLDCATGEQRVLVPDLPQMHQSASPDGRWVVMDAAKLRIGDQNGLTLVDQRTLGLHPLCQLRCSWRGVVDEAGRPMKSEFLHPNPNWSRDGRYVSVGSDFGSMISQVHVVDTATFAPDRELR